MVTDQYGCLAVAMVADQYGGEVVMVTHQYSGVVAMVTHQYGGVVAMVTDQYGCLAMVTDQVVWPLLWLLTSMVECSHGY